jgi:ornithine cyclodeaminase/alanine dehydrogenase
MARTSGGQVAGIFGAGVQAKMQLWAVAEARKLSSAMVYDVSGEAADSFISEMGAKLNLEIKKAGSADEVLVADIICTATSSPTPIFEGKKLREGTHLNGIGSHTPAARELDTDAVKRSRLVGDSREACFSEAGDIMIPIKEGAFDESHFYAELGEVVTGKKKGRTDDKEITLFKSNGLAVQDAAAAKVVYDKAVSAGIGSEAAI